MDMLLCIVNCYHTLCPGLKAVTVQIHLSSVLKKHIFILLI